MSLEGHLRWAQVEPELRLKLVAAERAVLDRALSWSRWGAGRFELRQAAVAYAKAKKEYDDAYDACKPRGSLL